MGIGFNFGFHKRGHFNNNFLFLETYIIISHSLVDFLEVDEHFLEIWWTFFLAVNY